MLKLTLALLATLLIAGCGAAQRAPAAPTPAPASPAPAPTPATPAPATPAPAGGGFVLDRQRVITALQQRMSELAPQPSPKGLPWRAEHIALLGPNYALVDYSEGHYLYMSLYWVEAAAADYKFTPVLTGERPPQLPVVWDWKAG